MVIGGDRMATEQSGLLRDWQNGKGDIEGFLADPLEWVATEMDKAKQALLKTTGLLSKPDISRIETLIDIIRFVNEHRNLL